MHIIITLGILLILTIIGLNIYMKFKMKNSPLAEGNENILTLTETNFKHQTQGKIVLVDFWAPWCGPCRMMAPILNDLAKDLEDELKVGKVNVDEQPTLANQFQIRSIPTLIIFKDGKEVKRLVGIKPKEILLKEMKAWK